MHLAAVALPGTRENKGIITQSFIDRIVLFNLSLTRCIQNGFWLQQLGLEEDGGSL
jgi:hypothetical protein